MLDKPWFSRKQLNIIIVLTTLAIALLSLTGKDPLPAANKTTIGQTPVTFIEDDLDVSYLRLSFPLPAGNSSDQFLSQLFYTLLTQRLEQSQQQLPPAWLQLQFDRLQIDIISEKTLSAEQLQPLFSLLSNTQLEPSWQKAAEELRARRYLSNQSNPSVMSQLSPLLGYADQTTTFDANEIQAFHQQIINRENLRLSYLGPDFAVWQQPLVTALGVLPEQNHSSANSASLPPPQQLNQPPKGYKALLLRETAGRRQADYPSWLASVRLLNRMLSPRQTDWISSSDQGLWLITSQDLAARALLSGLRRDLQTLPNDDLEKHLEGLQEQLSALVEKPESLLNQLEIINLYDLPSDYLANLAEQLEAITPEQLRTQASDLLNPRDFYWLSTDN